MRAIEQKLKDHIGLDVAALGRPSFERIVRTQMESACATTAEEYLLLLNGSPRHWAELIEAVIVPETWFFRDADAFAGLSRCACEDWLPRRSREPVRLLSLPCSSGEEPYSMAMCLLDAGMSPEAFRIDALDISSRALSRARRGLYGRNAFRGQNLSFRRRHFRGAGNGFQIDESVKACVRFGQGNLLSEGSFDRLAQAEAIPAGAAVGTEVEHPPAGVVPESASMPGYSCIFCRNLLIYFDEVSQERALARLRNLLRPGGFLFVGPAEQGVALAHGFARTDVPSALVWRAGKPQAPENGLTQHHPTRQATWPLQGFLPHSTAPVSVPPPAFHNNLPRSPRLQPPVAESRQALDLTQARQLADLGRLEEARQSCRTYLEGHPDSADAYYLLGLVHDAAGLPDAVEHYRRALYLDPEHQAAMLQLALSAERHGDRAAAAGLRRRARRCKTGVTAE